MARVKGTVEVELSNREIAKAIFQVLCTEPYLGTDFDDAGCDLKTDYEDRTYMMGEQISSNRATAALVNAFNVLQYGYILRQE